MEALMKQVTRRTPEQFPKPSITEQDAKTLLLRLFSLSASEMKEFPSYDDRTYYVKTALGEGIGGHTEFVLKVLNAEYTSHGPGAVSTQMDILNYLKSFPELKCQVPMATVDGKLLSYEIIRNDWMNDNSLRSQDALSAVRMYRYLPGQTLHDVSPLPSSFFFQAGRQLGDLQQALQTYPGDIGPLKQKAAVHSWCLDNVPWVQQHLDLVQDISKRMLVEEVIAEFEKTVVPVQGELRKGIIHHDYNNYNVLVTPSVNDTFGRDDKSHQITNNFEISGLIDFDSMVYTCLVYEIAVSMMYIMMCSDEPLQAAAHLLAGFESRAPLPPNERRLLRVLAGGRFAQDLVYSLLSIKLKGFNDYVGSTQDKGWKCLELLWGQSEQDLVNLWDRT